VKPTLFLFNDSEIHNTQTIHDLFNPPDIHHGYPFPQPFTHPVEPHSGFPIFPLQTKPKTSVELHRPQVSPVFDDHSFSFGEDNTDFEYTASRYHPTAVAHDFETTIYDDVFDLDFGDVTAPPILPELLGTAFWLPLGTTSVQSAPSLADGDISRFSPTSMGTTVGASSLEELGAPSPWELTTPWNQSMYV
jgi:hypothetical protein